MFKVCGFIGISKIEFCTFYNAQMVKQNIKKQKPFEIL